jgi:hypothetical protein
MSSSSARRMKIGDFVLRRLEEAGIRHLFGVPGDYNLELLQQLQDTGTLKWIGTCSELNASYAADGYARLNGLGALLVTNGVGALSAINGVGGSYSDHVPRRQRVLRGGHIEPWRLQSRNHFGPTRSVGKKTVHQDDIFRLGHGLRMSGAHQK